MEGYTLKLRQHFEGKGGRLNKMLIRVLSGQIRDDTVSEIGSNGNPWQQALEYLDGGKRYIVCVYIRF